MGLDDRKKEEDRLFARLAEAKNRAEAQDVINQLHAAGLDDIKIAKLKKNIYDLCLLSASSPAQARPDAEAMWKELVAFKLNVKPPPL
jgi:hypothetical protein